MFYVIVANIGGRVEDLFEFDNLEEAEKVFLSECLNISCEGIDEQEVLDDSFYAAGGYAVTLYDMLGA